MQINLPVIPEQGKRTAMYIGLGVLILAGLGFGYKMFFYKAQGAGIYTVTPAARGMAGAPTHETPPVKLRVYDKKQAGKLMGIPEIILQDPREVTATATFKPSAGGYTAAAVTDTVSGETQIIQKEIPRPLFGFMGQSEIGIRGGIGTAGQAVSLYARQDLFRIGTVNVAGYGEAGVSATSAAEAKAMIDVSIRW